MLATVYKKDKAALISIASWADGNSTVQLNVDWNKLGIDSSKAHIVAPEIKGFQTSATFKTGENIPVEKTKALSLSSKNRRYFSSALIFHGIARFSACSFDQTFEQRFVFSQ